jgi:hypothetical protein
MMFAAVSTKRNLGAKATPSAITYWSRVIPPEVTSL